MMTLLPRLRGMLSAATTVNFVVVKATHFGVPRLSERASPSKLWRSVNLLLGRGKPPASFDISVDEFSQFFHDKVDAVKQNTAGAPEPTFLTVRPGASLVSFTPISVDDVVSVIYRPRQTRFRSR